MVVHGVVGRGGPSHTSRGSDNTGIVRPDFHVGVKQNCTAVGHQVWKAHLGPVSEAERLVILDGVVDLSGLRVQDTDALWCREDNGAVGVDPAVLVV